MRVREREEDVREREANAGEDREKRADCRAQKKGRECAGQPSSDGEPSNGANRDADGDEPRGIAPRAPGDLWPFGDIGQQELVGLPP